MIGIGSEAAQPGGRDGPPRQRSQPSRRLRRACPCRFSLVLLALAALAAAACGGTGGSADDDSAPEPVATPTTVAPTTTTAAAATTAPPATAAPTTTEAPATTVAPTTTEAPPTTQAPVTTQAPTTTAAPSPQWELVAGGEDCTCADGSEYAFWVREADPTKLVFYLQGGGACFSRESCSFTDGNYDVTVDESDDPSGAGGIFDFDNPLNPLADHSVVAALYCTGDVHVGNATTDYGDGLVVRHNGFVNANTALAAAVERFGDAREVVVAGSSAGSAAAPLYGGLAADAFADASITVIADASGAYPSVPAVNSAIGGLWGTDTVIPDWPVNEGLTAEQWGLPELFVQAGLHAPRVRFARFDNAFDSTQEFFAGLAGFDASRIDQLMEQNEAMIEAAGVRQSSYTAPGDDHTILLRDSLYTLEVEGVPFLDWLTAFLAGEDVDDVSCVDCA